jgi:hypothetical protein
MGINQRPKMQMVVLSNDDKMFRVVEEVVRHDQEPHPAKSSNSRTHRHRTYLRRYLLRKNHHKDGSNPEVEVVGLARLPLGHMDEALLHTRHRVESSVATLQSTPMIAQALFLLKVHYCHRMHRHSFPINRLPNHKPTGKQNQARRLGNAEHQNLQRLTCQQESMRISTTASMNVPSVRTKFCAIQKLGHVTPAGRYSTSPALRSGLLAKAQK